MKTFKGIASFLSVAALLVLAMPSLGQLPGLNIVAVMNDTPGILDTITVDAPPAVNGYMCINADVFLEVQVMKGTQCDTFTDLIASYPGGGHHVLTCPGSDLQQFFAIGYQPTTVRRRYVLKVVYNRPMPFDWFQIGIQTFFSNWVPSPYL